ncbi:gene transfer agent family protein [Allomesorhizobium alhagi]|uniref:Gene transfer agent family protein n=1 Tax=Mesorhizobium alhagi CCNWXJ12-2 TaxID=1107882 RepID=H0HR37_9HYPH|nr:gene transfer agent family protein [Mesorhizobium alhagi]EHK56817.1 hypothetical protein MAXJ12_13101 [Mesorhizobium alhagi CCNWXJ12-2]
MSRDASVTLDFGDNTYLFRLAWGELEKLQEERDTGPYVILDRLLTGRWLVQDIASPIRLGLIGGGMEPIAALKLTRAYVEGRPPLENLVVAQRVLGAGLLGASDEDEVGKKSGAASPEEEKSLSPTENSDLPPSTGTEPSSASRRKKSAG